MNKIKLKPPTRKIPADFILYIILSVFFISKMLRSFSLSDVSGGVWNYIQIALVLVGFIIIFLDFPYLYRDSFFVIIFGYTILSMLHGLFFLNLQVNDLFDYIMISFPLCILVIFYKSSWYSETINNQIIVITYYVISAIFIGNMLGGGTYSSSLGAVADVYYILGLLPLMLVYTKEYVVVPFAVGGIAILISGKRAGIILYVIMIIVYYGITGFQTRDIKKKIKSIFALFASIFLFVVLFNILNDRFNEFLLYRIQIMLFEGDSSGRNIIWQHVVAALKNSSIIHLIFGHGDGAVSNLIGSNAHNDFLEIFYNFGLLPLILYVAFYIRCIFECIKMLRVKYEYTAQFVISVICSIGLSMVSFYAIAPTYIVCGMMCIGLIEADFRKKNSPNSGILRMKKIGFMIRS